MTKRIVFTSLYYDGFTSVLAKAFPILLVLMPALHAESTLLECVADAWYSQNDSKLDGSGQTLKLDGSGGAILLDFRNAAMEHWKVEKAVIVLHLAEPSQPVDLAISLTDTPWRESSLKPPHVSEASPTVEKVKPDGWISIAVPQAMAQALADGKATGLALSSPHATQIFHARETIQYSPFLAVIGRPPGAKAASGSPIQLPKFALRR